MLHKLSILFISAVSIITNECIATRNDGTIVHLEDGSIRGRKLSSQKGITFYSFQEVPYASPPIGSLRFKEPVPVKPWHGILNTQQNTKICHQSVETNDTRESEDCLYLNVYTPVKPCHHFSQKLPVLVYIHGGGFGIGDGTYETYGPEFWMDYGIIIVTINYRLGPFGFLTTEDRVIPANNGLKDQNLALKWIQRNIDKFGGDPTKVTVSGESSGGVSADFHMLNRKGSNLLRAAILQSGNALNYYIIYHNARETAYRLANLIDNKITSSISSSELLKFLQNASVDKIKEQVANIPWEFYIGAEGVWVAAFEDPKYKESFIVGKMHENYKDGKFNKIPTLIGFTSEEYITWPEDDLQDLIDTMKQYDNDYNLFVNKHYNIHPSNLTAAGNAIRKIYTDGLFQNDIGNSVRFQSDARETVSTVRRAELQAKYSPVYFYQFSYSGELGGIHKYVPGVGGLVGHTEELKYMWRTTENADLSKYPESDRLAQTRLLTLWSNFVKYLNPTPKEDRLFNNVKWPVFTQNNFVYLNISDTLEVKKDPKEYKKWKQIIDTYGNPPFETY